MAHFVADFLPLNGNDFFDMAGEMPPQLRVLLNVPEDFDESFFKYDDAGAETERKTWFENQDKLKELLIERYRNAAAQRLRGMRQGRNLGSIGVYNRVIELDAGVTMQYASLWGREYVTLIFAEWLVRRLLEKIDISKKRHLLVLYGKNEIAAVDISSNGKFSLVKKRKLVRSKWETPGPWSTWYTQYTPTMFLKTAQVKTSKNFHAVACPIKIDDWVISVAEPLQMYCIYNVEKSLNGYSKSSTLTGLDPDVIPSVEPIINGSGDHIYNHFCDKFTDSSVSGSGATVVSSTGSGAVIGNPTNSGFTDYLSPAAIGPNGERWSPMGYVSAGGPLNNGRVVAYTAAQRAKAAAFFAANSPLKGALMWYYGPGDSDFTTTKSGPEDAIPSPGGPGGGSDTATLTSRIQTHSFKNGLSAPELVPITVTITFSNPEYGVYNIEGTYGDIAVTDGNGNQSDPVRWFYTKQFPYHLSATSKDMYYTVAHLNTTSQIYFNEYHTPYESWETPRLPGSEENAAILANEVDQYFYGWLHLADDKNLIQGYFKNNERRIYLNRVEVGNDLAKVIGCDLDDIVTMFLGVKLADIDKLK